MIDADYSESGKNIRKRRKHTLALELADPGRQRAHHTTAGTHTTASSTTTVNRMNSFRPSLSIPRLVSNANHLLFPTKPHSQLTYAVSGG